MVELLLNMGADIHVETNEGQTARNIAAERGTNLKTLLVGIFRYKQDY